MKKIVLLFCLVFTVIFNLSAEEQDWFAGKMPDTLITAAGKKVDTAGALKGKMVAFYFSAHWCGPCRGFTPHLVKFYKKVSKSKNIEIVFVSSDKSAKDMKNYMKSAKMPWLAMPFDDPMRLNFKKEMGVAGIPTLIVFDENGKMLTKRARWDVVMRGNKAVDAWKSEDYTPCTFEDYKKSKKSKRSKKK